MTKTRYEILDGLRGYFLVFMMLNHMLFTGGLMLKHANHAELGYVQDAQGFVFLSGLILGLLYMRNAKRDGIAAIWDKARLRARDLFVYNTVVVGIVLVASLFLPGSSIFWRHMLGLYDQAGMHAVSALLMLYQPSFMDILPQYIVYLLISPFVIRALAADRWVEVVGASFALWFAVQMGLHMPIATHIEQAVQTVVPGFGLRVAFNPLAWQVLFVGGLVLGAAVQTGKLNLARVMSAERTGPLWLCVALVLLFMTYRLGNTWQLLPATIAKRIIALDNRTELSTLYVVNFIATGYVITWLMTAGTQARSRVAQVLGRGLQRLFALRFLNFLGKHSLQVYAYHVIVIYLLVAGDWTWGPFDEATKTLIALALIASLLIPAKIHGWYMARKARGAPPPAATLPIPVSDA